MIELVVVVAIVSLLLALLLPAVQAAHEAARLSTCRNHLKQIGIALQNYHDSHRGFPTGVISRFASTRDATTAWAAGAAVTPQQASPETPWTILILPYLEQRNAFRVFDSNAGVLGYLNLQPPYLVSGLNANAQFLQLTIPGFQCPSDSTEPFIYDVNVLLGSPALGIATVACARGNYAGNWGNTTWDQSTDLDGDGVSEPGVTYLVGPFGRTRREMRDVKDGLDTTIFVAEVRKGTELDCRGAITAPLPGGSLYMSRFRPNGTDDSFRLVPSSGTQSGDQLPFGPVCVPEAGLPCAMAVQRIASFSGSRSRHAAGVQSLTGSGSVRFISNSVDDTVWRALHSIAGSDTGALE